jgi:hypothetical protein
MIHNTKQYTKDYRLHNNILPKRITPIHMYTYPSYIINLSTQNIVSYTINILKKKTNLIHNTKSKIFASN